jgi:hypothetical protein
MVLSANAGALGAQPATDHNMLESITAARTRHASRIIACRYFLPFALACPRPGKARRWCSGKNSTNCRLMAKLSDGRSKGNCAMIDASFSAASAFGKTASRALPPRNPSRAESNPKRHSAASRFIARRPRRKGNRSDLNGAARIERVAPRLPRTQLTLARRAAGASQNYASVGEANRRRRQLLATQFERLHATHELFCASADNRGIRGIASRHLGPAALLDDRSPVPG